VREKRERGVEEEDGERRRLRGKWRDEDTQREGEKIWRKRERKCQRERMIEREKGGERERAG
jgi:hypothetical protein